MLPTCSSGLQHGIYIGFIIGVISNFDQDRVTAQPLVVYRYLVLFGWLDVSGIRTPRLLVGSQAQLFPCTSTTELEGNGWEERCRMCSYQSTG